VAPAAANPAGADASDAHRAPVADRERSGRRAKAEAVSERTLFAIWDEDSGVRRSLHRLVQAAGYAAQTFGSAREYLEWLSRGQAACLVLDVHMNGMSGLELQQRLAAPVLFITSHDDAVTRTNIEKSGAAGHLWKPFEEQAVLEAIRRAVTR